MPRRWLHHNRMAQSQSTGLQKLLGELEVQVMEHMWTLGEQGEATVRDVATALQQDRQVAYTTVMTVMAISPIRASLPAVLWMERPIFTG